MDDDSVGQFIGITGTSPERAQQYLRLTDGNIEQAIELFYASDGVDLGGVTAPAPTQSSHVPPVPPPHTRPTASRHHYQDDDGIVHIDTDEENSDGNEPEITGHRVRQPLRAERTIESTSTGVRPPVVRSGQGLDDDEAMARRLQEELYAGGDLNHVLDPDGVRAPIARTRETLVGPGSYDIDDDDDIRSAVLEQVRERQQRQRSQARPGIFNQQPTSDSIWSNAATTTGPPHRARLAQATAGASEASSKSNLLAEMYRPPFELMSRSSWEDAREEGKQDEKWILVNIQDPAIFDCQVLNRDIWKNVGIRDTVKENFIFMQYSKDDPRGGQYMQYYFQARESQDAYPHIAIVDPRTGEQVKVWSGPPTPKPMEFLMQLHEFLDRYSLNVQAKNPVARRKPEPKKEKKIEAMTEEEMLELAMQNSLANNGAPREEDPDELTRSIGGIGKGKGKLEDQDAEMTDLETIHANGDPHPSSLSQSLFSLISSTNPHFEPPIDSASTRIQFRHPDGRVVRRFQLADPVRRIYEWQKANPLGGKEDNDFELISMGKNLIEMLDTSIEQAGLKNGTVMVEFIEKE
ncbi:hypothetical protein MMC14_009468 [Varicellaria rhodocarpa]|nr:hypothetical protein [Varicellaria rhodocarpa]